MLHIYSVVDQRFDSVQLRIRLKIQRRRTDLTLKSNSKCFEFSLKNPMPHLTALHNFYKLRLDTLIRTQFAGQKLNSITFSCSFAFCSLVSILYTFNFLHNKLGWFVIKWWQKSRRKQHLFAWIRNILHPLQVNFKNFTQKVLENERN